MSTVVFIFAVLFGFAWINVFAFDAFDQMRLNSLKPDVQACRAAVKSGRKALQEAALGVPTRHHQQKHAKLQKTFESHLRKASRESAIKLNIFDRIQTQEDCDPIPPTLFPAPVDPTTTEPENGTTWSTEETSSASPTSDSSTETTPSMGTSPSTGHAFEEMDDGEEEVSTASKITSHPLLLNSHHDPYKRVVEFYDNFLNEDKFCSGPQPSTLADLTDGQLGGYVASLLTNHADFLCPFCHQFATHLHQKVLHPRRHGMADDERLLFNAALAHLPDPQTMCSAALPVCHNNYATVSKAASEGTKCLECSLCNTLSITILQKIFLNTATAAHIRKVVDEEIFKNICSEICLLDTNPGFNNKDQKACRAFLLRELDWIFDVLKIYLLPSNLCHSILNMCDDPNQPPNILHCLKLVCPKLGFPLTLICPLIPDKPEEAAKFLNIKPPKTEL